MPSNKKLLQAAAGNAGESLYVEDVFSTYLYTGTGSNQTITNGIDFSGDGGLVWLKNRVSSGTNNVLLDTERGGGKFLYSNTADSELDFTGVYGVTFNNNGFTLLDTYTGYNTTGETAVSWSFRKAEKFFDVVTYTGNGTAGRTVSHNLGSVPGCVIVKSLGANNWQVYHNGLTSAAYSIWLNSTSAEVSAPSVWNSTAPTSTVFTVGSSGLVNNSGTTYVAYLFASDAGGFGDDGDESIISCGSFTTDGSGNASVSLGYEPQWIMAKASSGTVSDWFMYDNMRGLDVSNGAYLRANGTAAETAVSPMRINSTGFSVANSTFDASSTYIYIAIRRPMKTPESGTEVFMPALASSSGDYTAVAGFPVDMNIYSQRSSANNHFTYDRLRGGSYLATDDTSAESGDFADWDSMTDFYVGGVSGDYSDYINWMFKRATGFFDVVAYTGDGVASQTLNHNLGVTPDFITVKKRSTSGSQWPVLVRPIAESMYLNTTNAGFGAYFYIDNPTSTTFDVQTDGSAPQSNQSGETYIAYLFATLAGVSKVGSYTGTGADLNVDCGFSAGARFILIKRTDSTGDWYVWDSARGIVAGNDPYILLNSTAAEVTSTDYIDPLSSGFTVTSSAPAALNASGGTYIFLAIA